MMSLNVLLDNCWTDVTMFSMRLVPIGIAIYNMNIVKSTQNLIESLYKLSYSHVTCVSQVTDGVVDVIMYPSSTDKSRNRGFAFVEYKSHKAAAMARRKLIPGTYLSNCSALWTVCLSVFVWSVCLSGPFPVSLPVLFRNPLCSGYQRFLCFFDLCQCKLCSCAFILYYRNLSAVGSVHPSGLGRAREGCGRGGYAARQSHICKSVDNRGNDCRVSIWSENHVGPSFSF